MQADNRSGFLYKRSENTSSKVLGMHRKIDTKTLNKLFSDSWPTDYIYFTNSSDKFEIGQDSDRNKVMAAKMADYRPLFCNMRSIWKTRPDS